MAKMEIESVGACTFIAVRDRERINTNTKKKRLCYNGRGWRYLQWDHDSSCAVLVVPCELGPLGAGRPDHDIDVVREPELQDGLNLTLPHRSVLEVEPDTVVAVLRCVLQTHTD
jgi:hypothetical protein